MMGSLLAACFNRLTCVRCPFGNRFVLILFFGSVMFGIPHSVFERIRLSCLVAGSQLVVAPIYHFRWNQRVLKNGPTVLAPVSGERMDPILESPAELFLISQLGRNLPIGYSFATITGHGLRSSTVAVGRRIDDRVMVYCFIAVWAYNLVFHLLSFRKN
jgi:hypothetical protein